MQKYPAPLSWSSPSDADALYARPRPIMEDYELVEMLLMMAQPRGDVKPLTKR